MEIPLSGCTRRGWDGGGVGGKEEDPNGLGLGLGLGMGRGLGECMRERVIVVG